MKNMKKIFALILATLLVLSCFAALADVNNITVDKSITVNGVDAGDKVTFYQIIKWVDGTGWAWNDGFEDGATAAGVTLPALRDITGYLPTDATSADDFVPGQITAANAAILAKAAAKMGTAIPVVTVEGTSAGYGTNESPAPTGLYVALVAPANADVVYNPIFVAADFSQNSPNSMTNSTETSLLAKSYSDTSIAKKETFTLTKEIDGTKDTKYDVNIGDEIPFTITSKVPAYTGAYIDPVYVITDTWEEGLTVEGPISVTIAGITAADGDYTVSDIDNTNRTFTVTVNKQGLDKVSALGLAQDITVTYKAKITSLDAGHVTVTEKTNEATVKFSNKPTDKDSYSLLEDKTRNYTFSIDANLLGRTGDNYETDELIKVGLDEKGNKLEQKYNYRSDTTWTELSPLQGAEFALFKTLPTADDYANHAAAASSGKLYTNTVFTTGFVTSDATGRLLIEGLDEGTYYLHEISAPAGFIRDDRTFTITISAEYENIEGGSYTKNIEGKDINVKYDAYKVLKSYSVVVNDGEHDVTSSYIIEKTGDVHHHVVDKATYKTVTGSDDNFAGDSVTPISNTKGTELPSTGGIGTTLFYVGGGILVLLAVVLLVTKRRMSSND